jgi:sugar phosphate isomerase/epimerase
MKLGFVSAILGDLSLEEVLAFADEENFPTVELMCWPPGKSDRRYAGVTHIDVTREDEGYASHLRELIRIHGIEISGLGYYPNPLDPNPEHRKMIGDHLKRVIRFAAKLSIPIVNTFIGRDPARPIEEQKPLLREVWTDIFAEAKKAGIIIGIENCPMIFSNDEWPGGKNLATTPATWNMLFEEFPDAPVGLNFDPSHTVWQFIDAARCIREFGARIIHVHAKDERIDTEKLYQVGVMGLGWHVPKLPGLGQVHWSDFFAALTQSGYRGAVSIEVEDRAYEGSIDDRKRALRQSKRFLQQYM